MIVGWREWIALPGIGIERVKAKIDTGARTSSLHAFGVRLEQRDGLVVASFEVHPEQRSTRGTVRVELPVVEQRFVRSSSGHAERRPVVRTDVRLGATTWPIELTLTRRDAMGFRMLLGREALRGRAVVDPARSFLQRHADGRRRA